MATFNLKKGGKFNIKKSITNVTVALGWQAADNGGPSFDPDSHVIGVETNSGSPKFYNDASHAVGYFNKANPHGGCLKSKGGKTFGTDDDSIIHMGDDLVGGDGTADNEQIKIDLSKIPEGIDELLVFITIYDVVKKKQNFGMMNDAFVRLVNNDDGSELCRYNLHDEFSDAISVQVGSLAKVNGEWEFVATGEGTPTDDLEAILNSLS